MVAGVLSPADDDPLGSEWRPDRHDAGRRILALARGDPEAALSIMRSTVGAWDDCRVSGLEGRREVACALAEIARAPKNFGEAARILLRLAATEGGSAPNGARGTFVRLFANVPPSMASTRAGADERAALLSELLDSGDRRIRFLALFACDMALRARNFMQVDCESGQPTMYLEWSIAGGEFKGYKTALRLLTERLGRMTPDERQTAAGIILERAVDLSRHGAVSCEAAGAVGTLHEMHLADNASLLQTTKLIVDACACEAGERAAAAWRLLLADVSGGPRRAALDGPGRAAVPRGEVAGLVGAGGGAPDGRPHLPPAWRAAPGGGAGIAGAARGGSPRDAFLSYTHEVKDSVARPLARGLEKRGVGVWWDHDGIVIGDKFPQKIREGLSGARYGVVVVSRGYPDSGWGQTELGAMFGKGMTIFPVLHGMTAEEAQKSLPVLSGRLMRSWDGSSESIMDEIASAIMEDRGDRIGANDPNAPVLGSPPQGYGGTPNTATIRVPAEAHRRPGAAPLPPPPHDHPSPDAERLLAGRNTLSAKAGNFAQNAHFASLYGGSLGDDEKPVFLFTAIPHNLGDYDVTAGEFAGWVRSIGHLEVQGHRIPVRETEQEVNIGTLLVVKRYPRASPDKDILMYREFQGNGLFECGTSHLFLVRNDAAQLFLHLPYMVGEFWGFVAYARSFYRRIGMKEQFTALLSIRNSSNLALGDYGNEAADPIRMQASRPWPAPKAPTTNRRNIQLSLTFASADGLGDEEIAGAIQKTARAVCNAYGVSAPRCYDGNGQFAWKLWGRLTS